MRMKNEDKNTKRQYETARRNEHLFYRKIVKSHFEIFFILRDASRLFSPLKPQFIPIPEYKFAERFAARAAISVRGRRAFKVLDKKQRSECLMLIDSVRHIMDLGKEWRGSLITYIMTGTLCPPIFNLHIEKEVMGQPSPPRRAPKARVVVILNPDTTVDDFISAFSEIERLQKSLRPRFKGFNLNKQSTRKLVNQMSIIAEKMEPLSNKEKYAKVDFYERHLLQQYGEVEGKKMILKSRAGKRVDRKQKKKIDARLSIKRRKTDADVLKDQIAPGERVTKKDLDRTRQERKRIFK